MPASKEKIQEMMRRRATGSERLSLVSTQGERSMSEALYVSTARIRPNPGQPRRHFDAEALDELAASIRQDGVMQPIMVRPSDGGYTIIMGERRYRAALLAGLEEVPVLVRELDDEQAFLYALAENLQRANLEPADEAEAYQGLLNKGYSTRQLAERIGIAQSKISRVVRIYNDPVLSSAVSDRQLTRSEAQELLSLPDEARPRLVQFIAGRRKEKKPLKMEELRDEVRAANPRTRRAQPSHNFDMDNTSSDANRITERKTRIEQEHAEREREARDLSRRLRGYIESGPLLAWDDEVAENLGAIREAAHRVLGEASDDERPSTETAMSRIERLERFTLDTLASLGEAPDSPETADRLRKLADTLSAYADRTQVR